MWLVSVQVTNLLKTGSISVYPGLKFSTVLYHLASSEQLLMGINSSASSKGTPLGWRSETSARSGRLGLRSG